MEPAGYHECLVRPSMVGEAAIIGQQLRLTVLADVPIEGVLLLPSGVWPRRSKLKPPRSSTDKAWPGQWTGGRRRYWVNPGAPRLMVMPSLSSVHS
jgi:hypothetical protein